MKADKLKQTLKPLIKECLKEILMEEGLTKMLSESLSAKQPVARLEQSKNPQKQIQEPSAQKVALKEMQENRKKMLEAIGNSGFDAFSGTQPLMEDKEIQGSDPGVDISKLMGENKQIWNKMFQEMNKRSK